ncbi:hypothetical protein ACHAXS_007116 [Conticribra weissflogii]
MKSASAASLFILSRCLYITPLKAQNETSTPAGCTIGSALPQVQCGPINELSIADVYFVVNSTSGAWNNDSDKNDSYTATVAFDWDEISFVTIESYKFGERVEMNSSYTYRQPGIFPVGYIVEFGPDAGPCANGSSSSYALLNVSEDGCEWGVTTEAPTLSPSPTTAKPSRGSNFPAPDSSSPRNSFPVVFYYVSSSLALSLWQFV